VVAIFTLSALNLRQNRFDLNDVDVHLGDDLAVSRFAEDFSSLFCSEYEVEMWDRNEVYLLPSRAEVNENVQRVEHFQIDYVPWAFSLDSRAFYLLPNSSLHLTGCHATLELARAGAWMILYRGYVVHHGHRHKKHRQENTEVKRVFIPPSAVCNASSSPSSSTMSSTTVLPELHHTVMEEDTYVVVVQEMGHPYHHDDVVDADDDEPKSGTELSGTDTAVADAAALTMTAAGPAAPSTQPVKVTVPEAEIRAHYDKDTLTVFGTLTRTSYDVTKAKSTCRDHYLCRFSLTFEADHSSDVVIRVFNNPDTPMAESSFSTHCHPR
jgi:hypothetical protein